WLALVVIPAVCALVLLVLPVSQSRVSLLALTGLGFLTLALAFGLAGLDVLSNFGKLGAMTFLAWSFLWFFEELSWVVLVAFIIPWVDAYSVWRGPTKHIVNEHENVFSVFSFTFPVPDGTTHLGLPDLFFFALFLGATVRFRL